MRVDGKGGCCPNRAPGQKIKPFGRNPRHRFSQWHGPVDTFSVPSTFMFGIATLSDFVRSDLTLLGSGRSISRNSERFNGCSEVAMNSTGTWPRWKLTLNLPSGADDHLLNVERFLFTPPSPPKRERTTRSRSHSQRFVKAERCTRATHRIQSWKTFFFKDSLVRYLM
jgi:hypothetical protein